MIPVDISCGDYEIKNLNLNDLSKVYELILSDENNISIIGKEKTYEFETLKERYLESLINMLEFFCGIFHRDELIGIIKGRIENKDETETWILTFILAEEFRCKGLGRELLENIEDYFSENYGSNRFYAVVSSENERSRTFWMKNGYKLERQSSFLKINNNPIQIFSKRRGV